MNPSTHVTSAKNKNAGDASIAINAPANADITPPKQEQEQLYRTACHEKAWTGPLCAVHARWRSTDSICSAPRPVMSSGNRSHRTRWRDRFDLLERACQEQSQHRAARAASRIHAVPSQSVTQNKRANHLHWKDRPARMSRLPGDATLNHHTLRCHRLAMQNRYSVKRMSAANRTVL